MTANVSHSGFLQLGSICEKKEEHVAGKKKNPNISRAPGDPEAIQKNKEEQVAFKTLIPKCAVNRV